jgi:hypothetical protein
MGITAAETPGVRRGVASAVVRGAAAVAALLAIVRIVLADGSVAARGLGIVAVVLAAVLIAHSWQAAAQDRRVFALHVAALASLLVASGALVPTSLAAGLIVAAALRLARDAGGWPGLVAVGLLALAHAAGLAVHGADAVAPALVAGLLSLFVFGVAEPDRGAWCACEWSHARSINDLDSFYLRRDEPPHRRS